MQRLQRGILNPFKGQADNHFQEMIKKNVKWLAPVHDLLVEQYLDFITPTPGEKSKKIKKYFRSRAAAISSDRELDIEEKNMKLNALAIWEEQGVADSANSDVDNEFQRDFYKWLAGQGTDDEHTRTPWGRQHIPDQEVKAYLSSFIEAQYDFRQALERLIFKSQMGSIGLEGIHEHYIYYKYVIRGEWPKNPNLFLEDYYRIMSNAPKLLEGYGKFNGNNIPFAGDLPQRPPPGGQRDERLNRSQTTARGGTGAGVPRRNDMGPQVRPTATLATEQPAPPDTANDAEEQMEIVNDNLITHAQNGTLNTEVVLDAQNVMLDIALHNPDVDPMQLANESANQQIQVLLQNNQNLKEANALQSVKFQNLEDTLRKHMRVGEQLDQAKLTVQKKSAKIRQLKSDLDTAKANHTKSLKALEDLKKTKVAVTTTTTTATPTPDPKIRELSQEAERYKQHISALETQIIYKTQSQDHYEEKIKELTRDRDKEIKIRVESEQKMKELQKNNEKQAKLRREAENKLRHIQTAEATAKAEYEEALSKINKMQFLNNEREEALKKAQDDHHREMEYLRQNKVLVEIEANSRLSEKEQHITMLNEQIQRVTRQKEELLVVNGENERKRVAVEAEIMATRDSCRQLLEDFKFETDAKSKQQVEHAISERQKELYQQAMHHINTQAEHTQRNMEILHASNAKLKQEIEILQSDKLKTNEEKNTFMASITASIALREEAAQQVAALTSQTEAFQSEITRLNANIEELGLTAQSREAAYANAQNGLGTAMQMLNAEKTAMSAKQMELERKHSSQMTAVTTQFQTLVSEKEKIAQELKAGRVDLRKKQEEFDRAVAELKQAHRTDLERVTATGHASQHTLMEQLDAKYKRDLKEREAVYAQEIQTLQQKKDVDKEMMEELRQQIESHKSLHESDLKTRESFFSDEYAKIRAQYEDAQLKLKAQVVDNASKLQEYELTNTKLNEQLSSQATFFQTQLTEMSTRNSEITSKMESDKKSHDEELIELQTTHEQNLKELQAKMVIALRDKDASVREEAGVFLAGEEKKLASAYESQMAALEARYKNEIESANAEREIIDAERSEQIAELTKELNDAKKLLNTVAHWILPGSTLSNDDPAVLNEINNLKSSKEAMADIVKTVSGMQQLEVREADVPEVILQLQAASATHIASLANVTQHSHEKDNLITQLQEKLESYEKLKKDVNVLGKKGDITRMLSKSIIKKMQAKSIDASSKSGALRTSLKRISNSMEAAEAQTVDSEDWKGKMQFITDRLSEQITDIIIKSSDYTSGEESILVHLDNLSNSILGKPSAPHEGEKRQTGIKRRRLEDSSFETRGLYPRTKAKPNTLTKNPTHNKDVGDNRADLLNFPIINLGY